MQKHNGDVQCHCSLLPWSESKVIPLILVDFRLTVAHGSWGWDK